MLGEDAYELLSLKNLSTPVQLETTLKEKDKTYRVSISHQHETQSELLLFKFVSNFVKDLMNRFFPSHSRNPDSYKSIILLIPDMMRKLKNCDAEAWPGFKYKV